MYAQTRIHVKQDQTQAHVYNKGDLFPVTLSLSPSSEQTRKRTHKMPYK